MTSRLEQSDARFMQLLKRITFLRIIISIGVIVIMAVFTFMVATALTRVPKNTEAIQANCEARNAQLTKVNEKFAELNQLFDAAIQQNAKEGRPTAPHIIKAFEDYKKPIPLASCKELFESGRNDE